MTHQNHLTNGASLEDCHTNFFALTDLCGIKWRKLVLGERPNARNDPLEDPVLSSYARCLAGDILCVWRRVAAPKPEPDPNTSMFDIGLSVNSGSVTHPPLSLTAAKELWLFYYGEEPDLKGILSPELLKTPAEFTETGSWENGITYECRSLLFKALHNLIERCLLSKDVVRLGKWFVQPCSNNDCTFGKSSHHLSFSFAFFVHGESTVCASMDLRVHPGVRTLSIEYLEEAAQADSKPKPVILAPFGLAATLTGQSYRAMDPITQKALEEWALFYPLCNRENTNLPPVVEVISGGVKMRYPSKYVLVTDLDDSQFASRCSGSSMSTTDNHINNLGNQATMHIPLGPASVLSERVWQDCIANPVAVCSVKDENNSMEGNASKSLWEFADPTQKTTCICTKCRKQSGRSTTTSGKSSSRTERGTRLSRIPFHKRQLHDYIPSNTINPSATVSTSTSCSTSVNITGQSTTSGAATICTSSPGTPQSTHTTATTNNKSVTVASVTTGSQRSIGGSTPCSRNQHSIPESINAIPSVGSPGSIGLSPHPNSSLSQPTSVPPPEQMMPIISPIQPTSALNIMPATPIEHLDKNTPAPTPTDQQDSKSNNASPFIAAPASVEAPQSIEQVTKQRMETMAMTPGDCGNGNNVGGATNVKPVGFNIATDTCNANGTTPAASNTSNGLSNDMKHRLSSLKRPALISRDYETYLEDDAGPRDMLYDYSSVDAWMNFPVKRSRPNDDNKTKKVRQMRDLYAIFENKSVRMVAKSETDGDVEMIEGEHLAQGIEQNASHGNDNPNELISETEIKKEAVDSDVDDKGNGENLYTSKGLMASYKDLDQIFDNVDDSPLGIQVHTPPGSNKSSAGTEDTKRCTTLNQPNIGCVRPEELSKMFPTPPSLEHHPSSSPCGGAISEPQMEIIDSPNYGSPVEEPIEDWSYVFLPPNICKFTGSSKYAPLTTLLSQTQLPSIYPAMNYKPSWQQQQMSNNNNNNNNNATNNNNTNNNSNNSNGNNNANNNSNNANNNPSGSNKNQGAFGNSNNVNISNVNSSSNTMSNSKAIMLGGNQSVMNVGTPGSMVRSPSVAPSPTVALGPSSNNSLLNFPGGLPPGMNGIGAQNMSPISPATAGGPPYSGGNLGVGSPMNPYRRNLLPPPPPYDVAIASPATSSSSSYLNKALNSQEPVTPSVQRVPEANALLLNILLYDTALHLFKDHNFDSCTLCVCNAGPKCVGNIRGSDSGVYLALPGTSFNPSTTPSGQQVTTPAYSSLTNYGPGSFLNSPANQALVTGYVDDDPVQCKCGFSAVVNRRLAHRSGLFYEDELEITGMAEDPSNYRRSSQFSIMLSNSIKSESGTNQRDECDSMSQLVIDMLQNQCTIVQNSCNSIHRAIRNFRNATTIKSLENAVLNVLDYEDAHDIVSLALEQSRNMFDAQLTGRMDLTNYKPGKSGMSVHKWPFIKAGGPRSNKDIVRVMRSMQPILQEAFLRIRDTRLWNAPYTIQGPLTWRQFHRMASSGSAGQCEPQPIPSIIVGHEKDWLSVSPYALQYWDKLMLEPYSYARDVAFVVLVPDNDYVYGHTKRFFKELSTTYEMCKLGRHNPIKGWDGYIRVGSSSVPVSRNENLDEWFSKLGDNKTSELLKLYALTIQQHLIPYLTKVPSDRSLLDPPEVSLSSSTMKDRPLPSPMLPPSTPEPSHASDKPAPSPKSSESTETDTPRDPTQTGTSAPTAESLGSCTQDEINPPCVVIYVVNPFSFGYDSEDLQRLACVALLRCYSNILNSIPESVRSNINLQIISMETIMELGRNRDRQRISDEVRCLAMSVFSQCRRHLTHSANVKSLTGFGTAANMEMFLKSKDEKNRAAYKLYTPPYILAARDEKSENTESFGTTTIEQQSSVMYCSYCLSEDQRWLLAAATDDRGELLETVTINIDVPNRNRRKKAPARRLGLQKLMDFIIGVISQSSQPWRLVIGRIGRIGHGELKGWSWLLSKQNLLRASKQLKDICEQCSMMYPHSVPSILSACLVALEPDSNLRVMPDQFTPDERFSQISMQSPLSTPHDVTCTHILVFPTSAVAQSSQSAFQEQHINDFTDVALFDLVEGDDGIDENMGIDDIFWNDDMQMAQNSPERSRQGSPTGLEDNRSRQSLGTGSGNSGSGRNNHLQQDTEEVGQVLQQPLALGYLVSTAPTGRMPPWFWAACPHLENVCPVFLKTALLLHSPSIHQNTDDILHQNNSSATDHELDSGFTADVLRYVLEGFNVLSWLAIDSNTRDRLSCLPIHVQILMQLYHMTAALT